MSLLLIALTAGCVAGPEDTGPELEASVLLGTGEWEWEDLDEDINVILGPQGGYHILGSVRVRGMVVGDPENLGDPTNPTTHFEVLHEGEDLVISSDYVQGLDPVPSSVSDWQHQMIGRFAILGIDSDDQLNGEQLLFRVTITDVDGAVLSDERPLTAYPDPRNG